MIDVIKDYLISLGMKIDKQSFSEANKAVNEVDKGLGKFSTSVAGKFVKIGAAATSLSVAMAAAMGKFAFSVAEADRQVGLLARRLYTTKENARSLSIAMKQMNIGSLDQLREVALDPEMRGQFLELKQLARSLENPKTQQALKEIRAMNFEFQKLMVRFEYFKMEVAAKVLEIFKQLKPTIQKIIDWFKPIIQTFLEVKESFKEAIPNILKGLKEFWKLLKPIINIIRGTFIFILKGWKFIFNGIKQLPTAFKTAFQVIKFILDPIIKMFRFIEDLIVYLGGGFSYREKLFDKVPFLRSIREGITGQQTENQRLEEQRQIDKKAQRNLNLKGSRNFKWAQNVHGFVAGKVVRSGGSYIADPNGLTLSSSNLLALKSLGEALGVIAKRFRITSGWESGHSLGSKHNSGLAMDFGFAGTTLQDQLALIRATLNDANISKALLEVDSNTRNQIYNQLQAEGADLSKLSWKPTAASSNHLHVENVSAAQALQNAQQAQGNNYISNVINVQSHDPKQTATETSRMLALLFRNQGVTP